MCQALFIWKYYSQSHGVLSFIFLSFILITSLKKPHFFTWRVKPSHHGLLLLWDNEEGKWRDDAKGTWGSYFP